MDLEKLKDGIMGLNPVIYERIDIRDFEML